MERINKFVTLGERKNGKIYKTETYGTDELINLIMDRVKLNDKDIYDSLYAYGKLDKIKRNIGRAICEFINEDKKGQHREERK